MKSAFKSFQIVLLLCGVFGAKGDEVKSVMEGDSVTLDAQIKTFNRLQWRFKNQVIAQINNNAISYPNPMEMFRDRLQLDPTGSLTIKNMKTKHSGLYELEIIGTDGTLIPDEKFNVTVSESSAGKVKTKRLSVKEGAPVTLQTDVTKLHGDELIVWRFGEGELIAKADIEDKSPPLYPDESFRGRLKMDDQTGSLTITNTRNTDSGLYTVKISSSKQTLEQKYDVTIREPDPGLSPAAVAAIVFGVLLLLAAAAVIYFRRKRSELQKQTLLSVSVTEEEDVPLKPNPKINKADVIQWLFGDKKQQTLIAEIRGEPRKTATYDYAVDERFRDRLYLDKKTGSLTITNSRTAHSGLYTLKISSNGKTSQQRFAVTVKEKVELKEVTDGGSVTLMPATEIQRDDLILWMFGPQHNLIAQIKDGNGKTYYDENRLKLDETTGSLTITKIEDEDSGRYKLLIVSSRGTLYKKFRVFTPSMRTHSLLEKLGKPVNQSATVEMQPLNR